MGLIDTDVLIENLKNDPVGKTLIAHYNLDGFIKSQPTVDAEPVRHGKWITYCKTKDSNLLICSECKMLFNVGMGRIDESHYCPNCGARMDRE